MGGHIGINNTMAKIKCQFFWPGMSVDVANFCRSFDICQKTASKGRVQKATLGRMPIIGVPFQRIAIDLAGPFTRSARGHTHILTVVDYATRYVEAIPLKTITTVEVAEALLSVYSRVRIPVVKSWELAQETLKGAAGKYKKYYDIGMLGTGN